MLRKKKSRSSLNTYRGLYTMKILSLLYITILIIGCETMNNRHLNTLNKDQTFAQYDYLKDVEGVEALAFEKKIMTYRTIVSKLTVAINLLTKLF